MDQVGDTKPEGLRFAFAFESDTAVDDADPLQHLPVRPSLCRSTTDRVTWLVYP